MLGEVVVVVVRMFGEVVVVVVVVEMFGEDELANLKNIPNSMVRSPLFVFR